MGTSGGSGSSDPVMRELFAAEVDTHLPVLSEGLLALEKGRAGRKEIESMMRAAHSIKGAARIAGSDLAVRIAHVLEDCFTAAKEERIELHSDAVDVLLQGVDALQRTCAPDPEPEIDEQAIASLLQRITAVRDGHAAPPPSRAAPAAAAAMTPAAPRQASSDTIVLPAVLDHAAAESLRGQFCAILERAPDSVDVDFGHVEHLGAAGLALLLSFAGEARSQRTSWVIEAHHVSPAIGALFRVVGLENVFSLKD
jgi:chemotaxis protein histidine kinase CheA